MPKHAIHGRIDTLFVPIAGTDREAKVIGFQYAGARPIPLAVAIWQIFSRFPNQEGEFTIRWAVDGRPTRDDWNVDVQRVSGPVDVVYEYRFNRLTDRRSVEECVKVAGVDVLDNIRRAATAHLADGRDGNCWLHLEIEGVGRDDTPRPDPVTVLGVVVGMAAEYVGLTSGTEEAYRDVMLDPIGRAVFGIAESGSGSDRGVDLAIDLSSGGWSMWDGADMLADGYVDLRGLYEETLT